MIRQRRFSKNTSTRGPAEPLELLSVSGTLRHTAHKHRKFQKKILRAPSTVCKSVNIKVYNGIGRN